MLETISFHHCSVCRKTTVWSSLEKTPDGWVTRSCNVCKQIQHVSPAALKQEDVICRMEWRDDAHLVKSLIFAAYENHIMGTRLGRFRVAKWGSNKLYTYLF